MARPFRGDFSGALPVKQQVVIDKSYLQGATPADVRQLCANGALMTDTLFAELLTTSEESRKRCFAKFPATLNPVEMIPSIGDLMRYEASYSRPCTPIHECRLQARFKFQPGIAAGTYEFTESELGVVRAVEGETRERVAQFAQAAAVVSSWFPELQGFPANGPPSLIDAAMARIATDPERVRSIYAQIVGGMNQMIRDGAVAPPADWAPPPRPEDVDEGWVWYRFVQVDLLAAVEFVHKHGAGTTGDLCEQLEHDVMDAEYVVAATLSSGLASRDTTMQSFFRRLCPNGLLVV